MYSFPNLEPVHCSMLCFNCCFLTSIQVSQEAVKEVWYSHLLPQFTVIHRVKGFSIINEAEVDIFLEPSCFFDDPTDIVNLISGSSAFLNPAWTSGSSRFTYYWSLAWRSLSILWHCLSLGLEWKLTFSSPVATAEFSKFAGILSAALSQHHPPGFERAQLEFHHLH